MDSLGYARICLPHVLWMWGCTLGFRFAERSRHRLSVDGWEMLSPSLWPLSEQIGRYQKMHGLARWFLE